MLSSSHVFVQRMLLLCQLQVLGLSLTSAGKSQLLFSAEMLPLTYLQDPVHRQAQ